MNFPLTRHYQRYEYVVECGYVTNKDVVDVGCGNGYGLYILAGEAKSVVGVDRELESVIKDDRIYLTGAPIKRGAKERVYHIPVSFEETDFQDKVDVITAIEVFEHVKDPSAFCRRIAEKCKYAFFTTPLAEVTGPTTNPDHVAEYSTKDFVRILEENFIVEHLTFQTGDMRIVPFSQFLGCSNYTSHVVQMAWCRSEVTS